MKRHQKNDAKHFPKYEGDGTMKQCWTNGKVGDIAVIKKGSYITKKEATPGPFPVILGGQEPAYYIDQYNHDGKAIVVSRSGASAGYVSFWNERIFVTDGFLIEPKEGISHEYLYYVLKCNQQGLHGLQRGAAIPHVTPALLNDIDVVIPPFEVREKISAMLSAYDRLIENNQKQIKLLEEAAQRLYKEWFADLRFPGHEKTKIIEGIPEGWSQGVLGDIVVESGKKISREKRAGYSYYLPVDCLPKKSLGYVATNEIALAESSLVAFSPRDIIFGAMRPYFHKVVVARDSGITRTTCFVLNAGNPSYWAYAVMLMFSSDTVDYATQISVGTTMPYTRWKDFKSMPIVIPSEECVIAFGEAIEPIISKINGLAKQIVLLQQARDRLLPKLMNGEIAV